MKETPLLYGYADGQVYPGIVVSPAPGSEIEEPTIPGVEELGTSLLVGTGAAFLTAGLLSLGPLAALSIPLKVLLTGSAFTGSTLLAHEVQKSSEGAFRRAFKFQVSPAPASQVKYPTNPRVEEI